MTQQNTYELILRSKFIGKYEFAANRAQRCRYSREWSIYKTHWKVDQRDNQNRSKWRAQNFWLRKWYLAKILCFQFPGLLTRSWRGNFKNCAGKALALRFLNRHFFRFVSFVSVIFLRRCLPLSWLFQNYNGSPQRGICPGGRAHFRAVRLSFTYRNHLKWIFSENINDCRKATQLNKLMSDGKRELKALNYEPASQKFGEAAEFA